jgi:hypothetical protein
MRPIEAPAKSFVSIARIVAIDGRRQAICAAPSSPPRPLVFAMTDIHRIDSLALKSMP